MKKSLFSLILCSFLVVSQISCNKSDDSVERQVVDVPENVNPPVPTGTWQKVFEDEFAENLSKWELTNRSDYNSKKCFYSSSNPKITSHDSKSCLELSASGIGTFTSGHVKSIYSFTPAKNEEYSLSASIKLLALDGSTSKNFTDTYGAWPAFWTVNEPVWPTKGEINIMEAYSYGGSAVFASNLFYGTVVGSSLLGRTAEREFKNTEGWHTYKLNWKNIGGSVTIETYLDDVKIASYTNSINVNLKLEDFNTHNIIFNLNVGSDSAIFDSTKINLFSKTYMYVDWVKVEKRTIQ